MEKKYISEISKCINNPFLSEALAFSDYEEAMEIVDGIATDRKVFAKVNDEDYVSNLLLKAMEENNPILMEDIIRLCEKPSVYNLIINIIDSYDIVESYDNPDERDDLASCGVDESNIKFYEKDLYECFRILSEYNNKRFLNYNAFAKTLLDLKKKKYFVSQEIDDVLSLTLDGEDAYNILHRYIKSLIEGNKVTYFDVGNAFFDNKPEDLMRRIKLVITLRENYYDIRKREFEEERRKLAKEESIGLKRKSPRW